MALKAEALSWPAPAIDTGLEGIGQGFQTGRLTREERREGYVSVGTSFQFLTGGGNLSSSPTQPSTGLGCEVCPEVLLALREISAMTVLLDRAQPDVNLRGGT